MEDRSIWFIMLISKTPLWLLLYSFHIVSEQDLGSYSCVFGTEAQIDFILAGKEINNESARHFTASFVLLSAAQVPAQAIYSEYQYITLDWGCAVLLCLHKHHHLSRFPPAPQISEVRDKPIVSYLGDFVVIYCKMEETKPEPRTWTWYKVNGTEKVSCSEPVQLCHWSFLIDIPSSRISYVHLPCFYSQEYSSRAALHVTHLELSLFILIILYQTKCLFLTAPHILWKSK